MERKRSNSNPKIWKYRIAIFILIVIIAILSFWIIAPDIFVTNIFIIPQLSTLGYSKVGNGVNIGNDSGNLDFSGQCNDLTINIERSQAISIDDGLNRNIGFRPNTHDTINDILNSFGINILMIKITNMINGTYFAKLFLKQNNLIFGLDTRPSDAIAIAARVDYDVPVYVNDTLLTTLGKKTC